MFGIQAQAFYNRILRQVTGQLKHPLNQSHQMILPVWHRHHIPDGLGVASRQSKR